MPEPVHRIVQGRRRPADQPGDGDLPGLVVQGGQEPGEHGERVGHRPAEHPAVYRVVDHPDVDEQVDQAA